MDNTSAWLIPILTLIGNTCITTIIGLIIKAYFTKYLDKKNKEVEQQQKNFEELEARRSNDRRQKLKDDIIDSVSQSVGQVVKPITDKMENLDKRLEKVEDGTLSTLRNDILTCYYRCVEKKYRNDYDYQNMHHMYESYAELNGNSYVADIIDRFDELPTKEEFKEIVKLKKAKQTKKSSNKKEI